ncbi:hypothetical protein [Streptomyces sp. MST-110588]|uniref:hypothetical protein n=1 Tax=Streptomyces sp. MST-110588 TaxID=2833628 RepID=UPI001F5DD341|nr:hypothetical protein [Streptomyces sp. MST-110588]UNO38524.1 hypothetical protein KGS77_01250 [Streptomyces sp. MST-110588]
MPRVRRSLAAAAAAAAVCSSVALTVGTTGPAAAAVNDNGNRAARHSTDARYGAEARLGADGRPGTEEPSLTGTAKLKRGPGDNVHFSFDAHGFADKARGTFYARHHIGKTWGGYFKGRIDCLLTGGPVAVATGVVTEMHFQNAPGFPKVGNLKGKRFGFTVLDDGKKDRLGYSWAMDGVPKNSVGKCVSSAPYETLEKGDFKVHHWMPSPGGARR